MSDVTVNDFDSDMYQLNKLVDNIFQALGEISTPTMFSFVGFGIAKPPLITIPEMEWFIPFPVIGDDINGE